MRLLEKDKKKIFVRKLEEYIKSRVKQRKIIKIGAEINEIENRKPIEEINEARTSFLGKDHMPSVRLKKNKNKKSPHKLLIALVKEQTSLQIPCTLKG